MLDLQRHLWGPDKALNLKYFNWKYLKNPFLAEPLIYLVLSGGKVVGMRGFMGADWQFDRGGSVHACPIACDLVVDPAHRKRGLFRGLMDYALPDLAHRGYRHVFNLSANPITYFASVRAGWRRAMPYRTLRRETRRGYRAAKARRRLKNMPYLWRYADRIVASLFNHGFGSLNRMSEYALDDGVVRVVDRPEPTFMAKAAKADLHRDRLGPVPSAAYFSWRFQNPMYVYRILIWETSHLLGYVVLQKGRDDPLGIVRIVDFSATSEDRMRPMLLFILGMRSLPVLEIWSATLGATVTEALGQHGFAAVDETRGESGYTPGILVRSLHDPSGHDPWTLEGKDLLDVNNWRLRMVLSDSL